MMNVQFSIRMATFSDVPIILDFIKALAQYEKMSDQVTATEEALMDSLFVHKQAEVILAFEGKKAVGFALFFHNYSTFLGQANLYLEDLYVNESYRGLGYGKALLLEVAKIAVQRNCKRLDWSCLKWNQPSIDFYHSLGAVQMDDWTLFRLQHDALNALGKLK